MERALSQVVAGLPGGGEAREGQLAMAEAVARAVESGRHLIVQAGTGTGKSLGYLVPAVLSGRRTVVATATKALQDQLATKDLPLLSRQLHSRARYAVLKGRSNYLCRQRALEVRGGSDQLELGSPGGANGLGAEIRGLLAWAGRTGTGDRAELDVEPSPRAWGMLSVSAHECPGASRCPSGDECFAEAARQRAGEADIVVVNTHLYGAHVASGGAVLPPHDVAVFDEAHELEDVASATLGIEIGPGRIRALARAVRPLLPPSERQGADDLGAAGDRLAEALAHHLGRRLAPGLDQDVEEAVTLSSGRLARVVAALRQGEPGGGAEPGRARALLGVSHLLEDLEGVAELGPDQVAWVEGRPHAPTLQVAPIEVGPILAERLWDEVTAVLTSATVPPGLATRVGLRADGHDHLEVGSPFPFASSALLYCAAHLPHRRSPGAEEAAHDELCALIQAAGGRTLALFTSWRAMTAAAEAARARLDFPVLDQSQLPKPALLSAFSSEMSACLFATMGFWQGVDLPGPTLSLVTIDRIPFPRPDEPLLAARRERAGQGAFRLIDLPRAATLLAQGASRLIRSSADRGVVAVLDPRLASASYRWELVRALPPFTRTRHRSEVEAFLSASAGSPDAGLFPGTPDVSGHGEGSGEPALLDK